MDNNERSPSTEGNAENDQDCGGEDEADEEKVEEPVVEEPVVEGPVVEKKMEEDAPARPTMLDRILHELRCEYIKHHGPCFNFCINLIYKLMNLYS